MSSIFVQFFIENNENVELFKVPSLSEQTKEKHVDEFDFDIVCRINSDWRKQQHEC